MDELDKIMQQVIEHCKKNKISVDLNAFFKKGNQANGYNWRL